MSWEIFRSNILRYANDPNTLKDVDTVAKLWATEYDRAIKSGFDTIHFIKLKKGNVDIMEQLIKVALLKGQSSTAPYDLVGEMGNAVKAYWAGAIMNEAPIPTIPAPGAVSNVSVVSNIVTNPGTWTPVVNGVAINSLEPPANLEMSEEELAGAEEDLQQAEDDIEQFYEAGEEESATTAEEQTRYQRARIEDNENTSVFVDEAEISDEETQQIESFKSEVDNELVYDDNIGKRIVGFALKDLGVTENPLPPASPQNSGARVLEMLRNAGINGPAYWCAAAVTTWYKSAGAKYPPSGAASCDVWMRWAKRNGLYSTKPVPGAAVLYGTPSDAHHIGIVETVVGNKITTIEGNTSGGGFNRNGVGVFRKRPNPKKVLGYVLPQKR